MPLPLHIFEPRYKRMIGECIEQSSPFGVVLEHEGRRAAIGAAAAVTAVLRRYPDGRLDIASEGRQRFRLLATDQQLPYLRGEVEWIAETDEDAAAERALALASFAKTFWAHALPLPPSQLASDRRCSWTLARSILLDLEHRQRLLEMPSEAERLEAIAARFEREEPAARRYQGNGHGR